MRAVITAGGTVEGSFAAAIGTPIKALAPFAGRTLLDIAIAACAVSEIDGIAVIGGAEVREHLRGSDVRVIDALDDGRANVLRALAAWPGERILYLTSDLPFVTAAGVAALIARSEPYAVTMGLASVQSYAARYADAAPAGVTFGAETVVNGVRFRDRRRSRRTAAQYCGAVFRCAEKSAAHGDAARADTVGAFRAATVWRRGYRSARAAPTARAGGGDPRLRSRPLL